MTGGGGRVSDLLSLRLRNFIGGGEERAGGQQSSSPTSNQLSFPWLVGRYPTPERNSTLRVTWMSVGRSGQLPLPVCGNVPTSQRRAVVVVVALSLSNPTEKNQKRASSVHFWLGGGSRSVDCTMNVIGNMP